MPVRTVEHPVLGSTLVFDDAVLPVLDDIAEIARDVGVGPPAALQEARAATANAPPEHL